MTTLPNQTAHNIFYESLRNDPGLPEKIEAVISDDLPSPLLGGWSVLYAEVQDWSDVLHRWDRCDPQLNEVFESLAPNGVDANVVAMPEFRQALVKKSKKIFGPILEHLFQHTNPADVPWTPADQKRTTSP